MFYSGCLADIHVFSYFVALWFLVCCTDM